MMKPAALALSVLALAAFLLACGDEASPNGAPDRSSQAPGSGRDIARPTTVKLASDGPGPSPFKDQSAAPSPYPPGTEATELGFHVRRPGEELFTYVPWESEETLNIELEWMRGKEGSCEVFLQPGRYEINQRIYVNSVNNLTITGSPGVEFYFRDGPDTTTVLAAPVEKGAQTLRVKHPERMEAGRRYQVYREDGRRDRILEFTAAEVEDGIVRLERPAHYMPHVKEIPAKSRVMEELTFFRVRTSPGFTLQGVAMDGRHRGGIRGHTIYCGVHVNGLYRAHQRATTVGLTVRNCTFKNLMGRGIVFYGLAGALIEGNDFEHIRAQAIEIDHFSSGHVRNNHVNGAEVGVMVNDAYESIVECNVLRHCKHGVRFLEIYDDPWVNSGNIVRGNTIGPGCEAGVKFFNEGMTDNLITGNRFLDLRDEHRVVGGEGNKIDFAPDSR